MVIDCYIYVWEKEEAFQIKFQINLAGASTRRNAIAHLGFINKILSIITLKPVLWCATFINMFMLDLGLFSRLNRAALHECEKDAKDKHHAQNIDDRMHQLRNSSIGIGYYPGIENVDNT